MDSKKHAKQSTSQQARIDGLIDVYVNGKLLLTCKDTDLPTQQVQYLIKISNGTITQTKKKKLPKII